MEIILNIKRDSVMAEVEKASAYAGCKSADFDRIAALDSDMTLLGGYWREAVAELVGKLRLFMVSAITAESLFELKLDLPAAYDEAQTPALEADIFNFLVAAILGRWYEVAYKEEASRQRDKAAMILISAHARCCYRKRPRRR